MCDIRFSKIYTYGKKYAREDFRNVSLSGFRNGTCESISIWYIPRDAIMCGRAPGDETL